MEEPIKKKISVELEVDTIQKGPNKFQKIIDFAQAVDAWRIFPRVFICTYIYLLYEVTMWFMALPEPNNAQSALVSVVVGAGAAWFGLYTGTGTPKASKTESKK